MSCCGNRRAAATAALAAQVAPEITAPLAKQQSEWIECSFIGPNEMAMRVTMTGNFYHLKPAASVKIKTEDWPILKRTGLLQALQRDAR